MWKRTELAFSTAREVDLIGKKGKMDQAATRTRLNRLNKIYLSSRRLPALHTIRHHSTSKRPALRQASVRTLTRNQSTLSLAPLPSHRARQESAMRLSASSLLKTTENQGKAEFPMTPRTAVEQCGQELTDYEKQEIADFQLVYYLSKGDLKAVSDPSLPNMGFDDDRGDLIVAPNTHIAYRFQVQTTLGKGSFGQVLRCFDHKRKEEIALKILRNKKRFQQQGAVEVKVLETLRDADWEDTMGIVRLKSHFRFRRHICMVFELLSWNLYDLLRSNSYLGLSVLLVKRITTQLLISLRFIREKQIIHCDLKPENVLLRANNRSLVKLIDFGSACFLENRLYTYIQSRFYRAPEIILGAAYSFPIDMWSLGCLVAELLSGRPLFHGEDEQEQLQSIMEVLGVPPEAVLRDCSRRLLFFSEGNEPRLKANSRGRVKSPGSKRLDEVVDGETAVVDFVRGCLDWDPRTRLTPEDGLRQPWLAK